MLYGLPASAQVAGKTVQVRERHDELASWQAGERICQWPKVHRSGTVVPHPEQFTGVPSAAAARRAQTPLGHQRSAPEVPTRDLCDYDRLCRVEVRS